MALRTTPRTPSAYDYQLSIKQLLRAAMVQHADQEIVYRGQLRFTYRQWRERVGRLASALAGLGVEPGSTVAVMDWDSHRYLECFFAIPMMGCVMQTVNVRLSPQQIVYTLNHAGADVILVNAEFAPIVAGIRGKLEKPVKLIAIRDADAPAGADLPYVGEYEALLAKASPDYAFPDLDEHTLATPFYTSGTTGNPKGVYYSHRQLVLHTLGVAVAYGTAPAASQRVSTEDVYMPITPMYHVHAWGFPYCAVMLGLKQIYCGRYDGALLLKLIREEGVTVTHCVPTLLHMLLAHPDSAKTDLSHLKMTVGGSAMPVGLAEQAMARGIDVISGYGMSETAPLMSVTHLASAEMQLDADSQARLRCLSGRAPALCELRIEAPDGSELPHDGKTQGELTMQAPWLTQGYYKEPEQSERLWKGGWLHSGDIATIDPHGMLVIRDRVKDVIKTGGEWISSLTLEDLISRHPGVAEVAVIAVHDAKWGERPLALVVAAAGKAVEPEAIRARLHDAAKRGVIPDYGIPDQVLVVKELAKTSVGKLDKKVLRQTYGAITERSSVAPA